MMNGDATFVAPATPFGNSGIAVVRVNGPLALSILSKLSKGVKPKPRSATLTKIYNGDGKLIDECIVTYFKSPISYTGDDLIEISCHGNPVLVNNIIQTVCSNGARLAEPGEFTKKAFINGKIDLLQSEAVGALIKSRSDAAAKINSQTLNGALSHSLNKINHELINVASNIEHAIDIVESEIQDSFYKKCNSEIQDIISSTKQILRTFIAGKMINDGIRVVITGKPNVGKSTLINCLSGSEKAIVSDIPGTTRDTVESVMTMSGVPVRFIDTAGIHNTDDKIEKIGMEKAGVEIGLADLVLYVFDDPNQDIFPEYGCPFIYILNKSDLHKNVSKSNSIIHISAKSGKNVDFLLDKIKKIMSINEVSTDTPHLTSSHQHIAISKSLDSQQAASNLLNHTSPEMELVAVELRDAISAIDALLGKTSPDDILNNIFKNLCVGK